MRNTGSEDGFTLVEVLVALAILGIAFAVLLGGMQTTILGSDIHRQEASAGAVLVQAAEAVKDEDRNKFLTCAQVASGSTYNPYDGMANLPDGWAASGAITVDSIRSWNGTGFQVGCPLPSDAWRLQRITLSVKSKNGRATETISVVKAGP